MTRALASDRTGQGVWRTREGCGEVSMAGRVLAVTKPMVPPWDDGTKVLVRELVSVPGRYRFILPLPLGRENPIPGTEAWGAYPMGGRVGGLAAKAWLLGSLLRAPKRDVVHFFFSPTHVTAGLGRMLATAGLRPMVHTVCSVPRSLGGLKWLLAADAVVLLSEWARELFARAGFARRKLHVIPPGLRMPEPVSREDRSRIRARCGLEDAPFLLYAGDYDYSDTAQIVAEAAVRLCRRMPEVRVVFAVRLKTEKSVLVEQRLKALVAGEGLSRQILFLNHVPGFQALLAEASLCVLPAETTYAKTDYPYVLLEAMAHGTPVAVSGAGALPELVRNGGGFVVAHRDPVALASALEAALGDPAALESMGEEARQVLANRFDARRCRQDYEALYDSLLGSGR